MTFFRICSLLLVFSWNVCGWDSRSSPHFDGSKTHRCSICGIDGGVVRNGDVLLPAGTAGAPEEAQTPVSQETMLGESRQLGVHQPTFASPSQPVQPTRPAVPVIVVIPGPSLHVPTPPVRPPQPIRPTIPVTILPPPTAPIIPAPLPLQPSRPTVPVVVIPVPIFPTHPVGPSQPIMPVTVSAPITPTAPVSAPQPIQPPLLVYITLENLMGTIGGTNLDTFENVCAGFILMQLDGSSDVSCSVQNQLVLQPGAEVGPIQVEVLITGRFDVTDGGIGSSLLSVFQEGANLLISFLQNASSEFFSIVFRASVSLDPSITGEPTASPTNDEEILGLAPNIFIGVVSGGCLLILMVIALCTCGRGKPPVLPVNPRPTSPLKITGLIHSGIMVFPPPPPGNPGVRHPRPSVVAVEALTQAGGASGLKDSLANSWSSEQTTSTTASTLRADMISRRVLLPPGMLGVVVDRTLDGPMVHSITEQSPSRGVLFPGDLIVSVNDVDTRGLSGTALTALLADTSRRRRELVLLSKDVVDPLPTAQLLASSHPSMKATSKLDASGTHHVNFAPRAIKAPPGKLGIVVDATEDGPVVVEVKPGSPLKGFIFPNDIIVSVNNVDARAMSGEKLTDLLSREQKASRLIRVVSRDVSDVVEESALAIQRPSSDEDGILTSVQTNTVRNQPSAKTPAKTPASENSKKDGAPRLGDIGSSTLRRNFSPRAIKAPPGKLGIVVDATEDGPVVVEVKPGSPLEGLIFSNDIIVSVNNVDARAMSGEKLTDLLSRKQKASRLIRVVSRDVSDLDQELALQHRTAPMFEKKGSTPVPTTAKSEALRVSRQLELPPGKLGIRIKSSKDGPVVVGVKPGSQLTGAVFPGNIIARMNDVDTRAMTGSSLNSLLAQTVQSRRNIAVLDRDLVIARNPTATVKANRDSSVVSVGAIGGHEQLGEDDTAKTGKKQDGESDDTQASSPKRDGAPVEYIQPSPSLLKGVSYRTFEVPPGRMGVVFCSSEKGHTVTEVKSESPIRALVSKGDTIVGINDIDTRAMTGSGLASIISRTSSSERKLRVLAADIPTAAISRSLGSEPPSSTDSLVISQGTLNDESVPSDYTANPEDHHGGLAPKPNVGDVDDFQAKRSMAPSNQESPNPRPKPNAITDDAVAAAPGRPGILISDSDKGHVVVNVEPWSELRSLISEGDTIVGLNDVDTRAMSSSGLTSLISRTSKSTRKFQILTHDGAGGINVHGRQTAETEKSNKQAPIPLQDHLISREDFIDPSLTSEEDDTSESARRRLPDTIAHFSVAVPSGRLGMVVNRSNKGHVVVSIKPGSQLNRSISEGDIIVGVNDVDTREMSGSGFRSLLLQPLALPRILHLITKDVANTTDSGSGPNKSPKMKSESTSHRYFDKNSSSQSVATATSDATANADPDAGLNARDADQKIKGFQTIAPVTNSAAGDSSHDDVPSRSNSLGEDISYRYRTVEVPPGRLGLLVKRTVEGHAIVQLKETSKLVGLVSEGDIIMGANDVDTRGMSGPKFTSLLAAAPETGRKLRVLIQDMNKPSSPKPLEPARHAQKHPRGVLKAPLGLIVDPQDDASTEPFAAAPQPLEQGQAMKLTEAKCQSTGSDVGNYSPLPISRPDEIPSVKDPEVVKQHFRNVPEDNSDRLVEVPPGRLGIVVETSKIGHIITDVKAGSQVAGILSKGDVIVGVNDVDTSNMSGNGFASLISRTTETTRIFRILWQAASKSEVIESPSLADSGYVNEAEPTGRRQTSSDRAPAEDPTIEVGSHAPESVVDGNVDWLQQDRLTEDAAQKTTSETFRSTELEPVRYARDTRQPDIEPSDTSSPAGNPGSIALKSREGDQEIKDVQATPFLRSSVESDSSDGDAASKPHSLDDDTSYRTVEVPPGRLGLLTERTAEDHIVAQLTQESKLAGFVSEDVNEVDTRGMTRSGFTSLLAQTQDKGRKLQVLTQGANTERAPKCGSSSPYPNLEPISDHSDDDSSSTAQSPADDISYRTVEVPPGRLGLVVESTAEGHSIARLKKGGQLTGLVSEGDIIIGVNEIDTRGMSGPGFTSLLTQAPERGRNIRVLTQATMKAGGIRSSSRTTTLADSGSGHLHEEGPPGSMLSSPKNAPAEHPASEEAIVSPLEGGNGKRTQSARLNSDTPTQSLPTGEPDRRTVVTGPGKLGIVVDNVEGGHVVVVVKPGSQMEGIVAGGDVIVGVNDEDTRALTGVEFSAILARTSDAERTLEVLSRPASPTLRSPGSEGDIAAEQDTDGTQSSSNDVTSLATIEEESTTQDTKTKISLAGEEKSLLTIEARPGKLGISIVKSNEGNAIAEVKPGSQLSGLVSEGDVIVGVNGEDTRAMSAAAVAALMSRNTASTRILKVVSTSVATKGTEEHRAAQRGREQGGMSAINE